MLLEASRDVAAIYPILAGHYHYRLQEYPLTLLNSTYAEIGENSGICIMHKLPTEPRHLDNLKDISK